MHMHTYVRTYTQCISSLFSPIATLPIPHEAKPCDLHCGTFAEPPLEREPTECALCKMLANLRDANVLHLRANCCPDFSKGWTASQMMLDLNSSFNAKSANKAEGEKTAVFNCVAVHPAGLADHSHARDRPDAAIWKTVTR